MPFGGHWGQEFFYKNNHFWARIVCTVLLLLIHTTSTAAAGIPRRLGSVVAMASSASSAGAATKPITIVTGSNKGIGYEILKKLAPHSSVSILAARNEALGKEAAAKLREKEGLQNVIYRHLDLENSDSIVEFSQGIKNDFGKVDILVNNAGMAFKARDPTPFKDQATPTLRTNFWKTIELIDAMTPLLRQSSNPKIVNVCSQSGRLAILDTDKNKKAEFSSSALTRERLFELMKEFEDDVHKGKHSEKGWPSTCYGMSKLGLIAFGRVFAKEEGAAAAETKIWLASCCPGWCSTDMSSHSGPRSAEHGARTPAWLALKGKEEGQAAGGFFYDEREIEW